MACCFEKAKTSVAIKGRCKVILWTTLICTKAAAIRPAISYFNLSCLNLPRLREVWTHPHSFSLFDTVEASFLDELRYSNLRETHWTFTYILRKIDDEISRQDTSVRKAFTPKRRLTIALYHLASTAEYRTIGNLFGVSVAFVCTCIKEVYEAIRNNIKSSTMCYLTSLISLEVLLFPQANWMVVSDHRSIN